MKINSAEPKPKRCDIAEPNGCYPVWDRTNNLKAIGLCRLHGAAEDMLKVMRLRQAFEMGDQFMNEDALLNMESDLLRRLGS